MRPAAGRLARSGVLLAFALLGLQSGAPPLSAAEPPPVSRYYGNMPFSIDLSSARPPQFHFTPQHIAEDSNLLVLHMDWFPIPWRELAAGSPPPPVWTAEMDRIAELRETLRMPVYLALTPISLDRLKPQAFQYGSALAGDASFGGRCEPISKRGDYSDLQAAWHAYVNELVSRFDPAFLALSTEINLYTAACPDAWEDMKRFLNDEYLTQKREHPRLVVFHTFQVETLWQASESKDPCFGFRRECLLRNFAPLSGLQTDLAALSVYPLAAYDNNGGAIPEDYLSIFRSLFGRPVAVAESGYPGSTFSALVGDVCFAGLPSSARDQSRWMERLLADAEALDMPFVVWWSNEAPLSFESLRPCRCTEPTVFCGFLNALANEQDRLGFRYFGLMGLRDYDGTPQPALETWRRAVDRAVNRGSVRPPPRRKPREILPRGTKLMLQ